MLFRYDPPVLLVGATWYKKTEPFIDLLNAFLRVSYHGHADLVGTQRTSPAKELTTCAQIHLISITLDGSHNKPGGPTILPPRPDVTEFLEKYPLAKIVIVIDTHCLQETGGFVWGGAGTELEACTLWEVGRLDCSQSSHGQC